MNRIVIIGTTGSGKSTLARKLAQKCDIPCFHLDDLYWLPNWNNLPDDEFIATVNKIAMSDRWIIEGNYRAVRNVVWNRADTLIWLDYSLPLVFTRLVKRTIFRLIKKEVICNGNRETLLKTFSKDSILLWCLHTHSRRKREFPIVLQQPEFQHLQVIKFKNPRECKRWMSR